MNKDDANPADRRRYQRTDVLLKVRYAAAADFLADYTENISSGGVFIATEEKFKVGEEIDFEVSFPGLLDAIRLHGRVKWVRPASGEKLAGIGVEFATENAGSRPLSVLVSRLCEQEDSKGEAKKTVPEQRRDFRVLLVEDNPVVRDMFRYGIQKMIHDREGLALNLLLREAGNGKEAWSLLEKENFSLVVLDLYMPVMDGTQLIEKMKQVPLTRNIPIVVVSSGGEEDRKRALAVGADIYLPKPIKLRELLDTIGKLIPA